MKKLDELIHKKKDSEEVPSSPDNFDVIKEKIKAKPLNKKKLLRRTIITASMAVIFGLIACFTFLILEPLFSNLLYPQEEQEPITFPEEEEEILPEDLLTDEDVENQEQQLEEEQGSAILTQEQIEEIVNGVTIDVNDYRVLYTKMYEIANAGMTSIVHVTGVTSDVDWFDNTYESTVSTYGLIVDITDDNLLILAPYREVSSADSILMTFNDGETAGAELSLYDPATGYAVFRVNLDDVSQSTEQSITKATLGSSNSSALIGSPIIALGSPAGYTDSLSYGMVTSVGNPINQIDRNYKLCTTDIYSSTQATGVVINLSGQVIGVIDNSYNNSDMENMLSFIGISELKKTIERLSNYDELSYLGVYGVDVTTEITQEYGVPKGAFIREIVMDSPAMNSGIQSGDVVTRINSSTVTGFADFSNLLGNYQVGSSIELTIMRLNQNEYQEIKIDVTLEAMK